MFEGMPCRNDVETLLLQRRIIEKGTIEQRADDRYPRGGLCPIGMIGFYCGHLETRSVHSVGEKTGARAEIE